MSSINLLPLIFNLLLNFKAYIAFLFLVFLSIIYRFLKLQSSRSSEAEQYFKRAIRLAPLDPSTHHHYGNLSFFFLFHPCSPQTLTQNEEKVKFSDLMDH